MEANKKLNLSAMLKNHQEKNDTKTSEKVLDKNDEKRAEVLKNDEVKTVTKKINISALNKKEKTKTEVKVKEEKTEVKPVIKTEIKETKKDDEQVIKLEEKDEVKKEIKTENKKDEIKLPKEDLSNLKNEENKKETKNESNSKQKIESKENNESNEVFGNYDGGFDKAKIQVIDKIKKLKNIPKTRPELIFSLILITAILIGGLYVINPQKYSIDGYKTSVIDTYKGVTGKIEKPWEIEIKKIEGFEFPIEKKESEEGNYIYRYKENVFENIEMLNNTIQSEVQMRKQEIFIQKKKEAETKVKNIILEKYGNK